MNKPVAAKNTLIIQLISLWPEHFSENIWKNISEDPTHNSHSNILLIIAWLLNYFQKFLSPDKTCQADSQAWKG